MLAPAPHPLPDDARLARVVQWYEQLSPASLAELPEIYHPEARFKDPFNEVQGHALIGQIFAHMFKSLHQPRFQVRETVAQGDQAFLTWDFNFQLRGRGGQPGQALHIHGATRLVFAADGRVHLHRDYWDAAEELYERLPLLGSLMRLLKRRLAVQHPPG